MHLKKLKVCSSWYAEREYAVNYNYQIMEEDDNGKPFKCQGIRLCI